MLNSCDYIGIHMIEFQHSLRCKNILHIMSKN